MDNSSRSQYLIRINEIVRQWIIVMVKDEQIIYTYCTLNIPIIPWFRLYMDLFFLIKYNLAKINIIFYIIYKKYYILNKKGVKCELRVYSTQDKNH